MAFETWLLYLALCVAPVISPGPGILFSITNALRYGARATLIIGVVNAAGVVLVALAVGMGLGALMAASAIAFLALKVVGAAYLIWLGVKIWRDRAAFTVDAEASRSPPPMRALCLQSTAIALTNPKTAIAFMALMPPFMDVSQPALPQVVIMALSYGALCVVCHSIIAYAGGWMRRLLSSPRRVNAVRRATGGTFIGFGVALAAAGRP